MVAQDMADLAAGSSESPSRLPALPLSSLSHLLSLSPPHPPWNMDPYLLARTQQGAGTPQTLEKRSLWLRQGSGPWGATRARGKSTRLWTPLRH